MLEQGFAYLTQLITVIGVLAFIISVITEVTKNVSFLAKIPTQLQVIVLSLVICVAGLFAWSSYSGFTVYWYYVVGVLILAFIVALVTIEGWEKVTEIWSRTTKKKN